MTKEDMKDRTRKFAIGSVKLYEFIPKSLSNKEFFGQLSGSEVRLEQTIGLPAAPGLRPILSINLK